MLHSINQNIVHKMSHNKHHLNTVAHQYLSENTVRPHQIFTYGDQLTQQEIGFDMQSPPEQLQFYAWLSTTLKPKYVLEIGTFSGLATVAIAESIGPDATITTIDHNAEFLKTAKKIWKKSDHAHKIHLIHAKASEALHGLVKKNAKFDIILIDANKNEIQQYYEKAHSLAQSGSVIIIDNILFSGKVADMNAIDITTSRGRNHLKYAKKIHNTNKMVLADKRVTFTSIAIGDGVTLATVI